MGRFFSFAFYPLLMLTGIVWILASGSPGVLAGIPAGLGIWTFVEYLLHRFAFHPRAGSGWRRRLAYSAHGLHHRNPRDPDHILVRPAWSVSLSAAIGVALVAVTGDVRFTGALLSGVWLGFLYYEWVHYRVHMSSRAGLLDWHRKRHFRHHFVDPEGGYGVTSSFWDHVFGTAGKD